MCTNYDKAFNSIRKEITSWKYRYLTIFGKVTVIKTLCLPKLNHKVSVVPNPSLAHLKLLESELKIFISDNNSNVVDETTRHMATKHGGLEVPNVNTFWKSLRMSWLRRSINSESTWYKLHCHEVFPFAFDPAKSNHESLTKAKVKCMNPFWKEIYASLISCRLNVLLDFPQEYRYIPINGEPQITDNGVLVGKDWSTYKNLDNIIDHNGNFREHDRINEDRRPLEF